MMIEPTYRGYFYDTSKPMDDANVMHKRMGVKMFRNLTDGIMQKEVYLDGELYLVKRTRTFSVLNTIDNTFFVVCDVEKVI